MDSPEDSPQHSRLLTPGATHKTYSTTGEGGGAGVSGGGGAGGIDGGGGGIPGEGEGGSRGNGLCIY